MAYRLCSRACVLSVKLLADDVVLTISMPLARLKGEMEALEQASIRKNCGIQFRNEPPPMAYSR
jgi:hypothetical protein